MGFGLRGAAGGRQRATPASSAAILPASARGRRRFSTGREVDEEATEAGGIFTNDETIWDVAVPDVRHAPRSGWRRFLASHRPAWQAFSPQPFRLEYPSFGSVFCCPEKRLQRPDCGLYGLCGLCGRNWSKKEPKNRVFASSEATSRLSRRVRHRSPWARFPNSDLPPTEPYPPPAALVSAYLYWSASSKVTIWPLAQMIRLPPPWTDPRSTNHG